MSRAALAAVAMVALALGCAGARGPRVDGLPADADPRRVLDRFTAALEAGRYDDAYPLLSARWRSRETPARLAADLAGSGAAGRDAVGRVRALLSAGAPVAVEGDTATLAVGEGRVARLTREPEGWRVESLE